MCKKLVFQVSFVLVISFAFSNVTSAIVLDPNLVGWWKLNETSGTTVVNSSIHGSVLNGTTRWNPTWEPAGGKINGCLYLNGVGQYVQNVGGATPSTLLDIQSQITIAFWFRGRRNPNNSGVTWEAFIAKGDGTYRVSRSNLGPTLHFGLGGTSQEWFDGNIDVNDTGLAEPEWHHVCATYDGARATLYIDGVFDNAIPNTGLINVNTDKLGFGHNSMELGRLIQGRLDNIRLYNRAVKQAEFVYVMEEWYPYAYDPTPADESTITTTTPTLKWRSGDSAAGTNGHKLYFDTNKAKVIARSGCQINGVSTTDASYPNLSPLAIETTYYWVVDEVNGVNTWKGVGGDQNKVWSFTVPAYKAYNPEPVNGATLVYRRDDVNQTFGSIDVIMSWKKGMSAAGHKVYFDTFSPPTTLRGTLPVGDTNVAISELSPSINSQYGTKYYWRIDEVNGASTWPGDILSFTTIPADLGLKGEYYNNAELTPPSVVTRKDLNINFDWGNRSPQAGVVNADSFSIRWTGELEVPETNTYTFSIFALGDDGIRFWVNDVPYINSWYYFDSYGAGNQPTIDLVKGRVPIRLEFQETAWGASCKLFWKTPSMAEREIIPIGRFYQPVKAWSPSPANGAEDVRRDPVLNWLKGEGAAVHDVYFSTDKTKVTDADRTNPLGVLVSTGQDPYSYKPEILEFNTTYYWRIDEVNLSNSTPIWQGNVWSFTTGNFLVVDDIEKYDANCARLYYTWRDGLSFSANPGCGVNAYPGNNTGAIVGLDYAPWVEKAIVHNGQSMPIAYDNTKLPYYSEASADTTSLDCGTNWTLEGVKALSLWLQGYPDYRGSWSEVNGKHTIIADGGDIYGTEDEFRFVYKQSDANQVEWSIDARVVSVDNVNEWSKAGVMIRNTLEPNSINAAVVVTPGNGVSLQYRKETGGNSAGTTVLGVTAPQWVRLTLQRESGYDSVTAYHANDVSGSPDKWTQIGTEEVLWDNQLYRFTEAFIGMCVTGNASGQLCRGVMDKVSLTGENTNWAWTSQEIGIPYNAPEPMYVILRDNDSNGIVYHPDPYVTQTADWTEWRIDLNDFRVQGVDLNNIQRMYIGFGSKSSPKQGGSGKMFIDDIRLYPPGFVADKLPRIPVDIVYDGVVNWEDFSEIANDWLNIDYSTANLHPDSSVAFDQDTFNVKVTDSMVSPSGVTWTADPSGYNNGTWYYYPQSEERGWWNVWFYNAPYDQNRWKEIEIELTVEPIVQGSGANAEIIVGGSTAAWAATPNGSIRPPLPSDVNSETESLYIDRSRYDPDDDDLEYSAEVYSGALTKSQTIEATIIIPGYNPEWVFIDVRGFNFRIVNGYIRHRCRYDIINLRDFAELGKHWGEQQQVWPTW
jgi:hypothetical protein